MRTFEGVRVIDFTQAIAGPFATYQLALMGADVIKVEQPGIGDQGRQMYPLGDGLRDAGYSAIYLSANAGKRSMTLDLKHPEAKELVHRLVQGADVVVENFKAGTMDRMGFGWADLQSVNPKLIYCAVTGFGQTGPRSQSAAYDPTIQAASGMMAVNGTAETGPMRVGAIVIDIAASITAAFAIAGALFKRERTGEGAQIDLSMQDVGASMVSPNLLQTVFGYEPTLMGSRSLSGNPIADTHPTKQGVLLLMPAIEAQSAKVWAVIGREELRDDPRFATLEARVANEADCLAVLRDELARDTAVNWERRFAAAGVPAAAVSRLPDVLKDEQLAHRGLLRETRSPADGRALPYTNTPFKVSGEETGANCPPPLVGADTDAVLGELGYDGNAIQALRESGVI
jgi:crotonobetainyl-CoA:carnitine CoA-transferase CaiB-like acyl-CoA transferase